MLYGSMRQVERVLFPSIVALYEITTCSAISSTLPWITKIPPRINRQGMPKVIRGSHVPGLPRRTSLEWEWKRFHIDPSPSVTFPAGLHGNPRACSPSPSRMRIFLQLQASVPEQQRPHASPRRIRSLCLL